MSRRSRLHLITLAFIIVACSGLAWATPDVEFRPQAPFFNGPIADRDRDTELVFSSFEDAVPPAGWGLVAPAGEAISWQQYVLGHSGQHSAFALPIGAPRDQTLVLPPLDFSALLAPKLALWELGYLWYTTADIHHQIVYATSEPTEASEPAAPLETLKTDAVETVSQAATAEVTAKLVLEVKGPAAQVEAFLEAIRDKRIQLPPIELLVRDI